MTITKKGLPTHCEFCGAELVMEDVNLVCPNPNCTHLDSEHLKAWCLNTTPIDGLGWKTIEKHLKAKNITHVSNFYQANWELLGYPAEEVSKVGSEKYLFNQMLIAIRQPKTVSRFLLGMKVPGLGKLGAQAVEDDQEFAWRLFQAMNDDEFVETPESLELELGKRIQDSKTAHYFCTDPEMRAQFREYFGYVQVKIGFIAADMSVKRSKEHFEELAQNLENQNKQESKEAPAEKVSKPVQEKGTVVITGKLSMKRADFEQLLKENGWKMGSSISKNTKYLITNDPDSNTTKNQKADALGIQKITEEDFMKII